LYAGSRGTEKAKYAKCLMDNFEKQFTEKVRVKVLENCGRNCIGASTIERAKKIGKNTKTLEDLVSRLNKQHIGGGKLHIEGNRIYGEYKRCYCGMVNKTKEQFSSTWCNCSRGYLLELFEQTLGKPVKVDLLESVIQGAKTCKFTIQT
jgi:predicted hydrocarbon binding protein